MSPKAKNEYVQAMAERYCKADRKEKNFLLEELCINCVHHRKYAIAQINSLIKGVAAKKRPGRPSQYNNDSILPVRFYYESTGACNNIGQRSCLNREMELAGGNLIE